MRPDMRVLGMAARAMARHGLAHAYGHVSTRIDSRSFVTTPPMPLGHVEPGDPGVVVTLDGELPPRALPEVRIHREIYRLRPEIAGVCRVQPPCVMALSALRRTPRALHGLGAYFAPAPPLWESTDLVRTDAQACALAARMGTSAAIVLSGNGAVTAGTTLEEAASLAFFLEDAARVELAVLPALAAGMAPREYTPQEAAARAIKTGGLFERMWQYLCFGDPEWQAST